MTRTMIALLLGLAAIGASNRSAHAQEAEMVDERQMTLPTGRVFIQGYIEMSLSADAVFKPVSIAPDIWYGATDVITVGLVHSGRAATGFLGGVGNGLCLTGSSNGCGKVYDNVGIDGRYHFYRKGDITASADAGLFFQSFDPFTVALKAGAIGRWQSGQLSAELAPSIFLGLTQREPDAGAGVEVTTNKEILFLPATAMYALNPKLGLAAQAGIVLPFEGAADAYSVALSIGAQYMVSEKILVDGSFSLPVLLGGGEGAGFDIRTFTVGVGYAL